MVKTPAAVFSHRFTGYAIILTYPYTFDLRNNDVDTIDNDNSFIKRMNSLEAKLSLLCHIYLLVPGAGFWGFKTAIWG